MAAPLPSLMSLQTDGTVTFNSNRKHVVPWKTRQEFQSVFENLFSQDKFRQVKALQRISTWRSRVGSKLSVAIDSCAALLQASLDYNEAKDNGNIEMKESQIKASGSLALIRFVNHVTEKGQTKSAAQPVHVLAKDFGIPEWIVRLRHDATHGTMPSLIVLMTGVDWALQFLKKEFWQKQLVAEHTDKEDEEQVGETHHKKPKKKKLKMSKVRETLYDFQKARFQELNDQSRGEGGTSKNDVSNASSLHMLKSYLSQDRLQLTRCLLQDGGLVSTPEQLEAFGVKVKDLLQHIPPTVPQEVCGFWRPLLRVLYLADCLPLLMHTALFSVTPETNLRNYQLVAWLVYFLAQSVDYKAIQKRRRKKKRESDLMTRSLNLPKRTLLTACLQNVTPYTIHLLKYLMDKKNMSPESFQKLTQLLHIPEVSQSCEVDRDLSTSEPHSDDNDTSGSDSDTIYTVEDLKKEKLKVTNIDRESASVADIENSLDTIEVPWKLCTDIIDWRAVPFGVIPNPINEDDDNEDDDDDEDDEDEGKEEVKEEGEEEGVNEDCTEDKKRKRKRRRETEDAIEDTHTIISPKRCAYSPKEELL